MTKVTLLTIHYGKCYGAVMQTFATCRMLEQAGHTVRVINLINPSQKGNWKSIHYWMDCVREFQFWLFKKKYFSKLTNKAYSIKDINLPKSDVTVVGSDQVWRPLYSPFIHNMFLEFVGKKAIRRVAYAASFGVDNMEYSDKQLKRCANLLKEFDGVSVRETSGVDLCRIYFGIDALHVLDPTLLNDKEVYEELCQNVPVNSSKFLASYVLDISEEKKIYIEGVAKQFQLGVNYFTADEGFSLTIEEWLAMFRDASFIITDSFHGTIFSIIFNKPFISLTNETRGNSRFESLLFMLGLEKRLNLSFESVVDNDIDWVKIREKIYVLRSQAFAFLHENLDLNG